MGTGLAWDKSFLVVHATAALVETVIVVVPSLVVVLAIVIARVVPALRLVKALNTCQPLCRGTPRSRGLTPSLNFLRLGLPLLSPPNHSSSRVWPLPRGAGCQAP